MASNWFGEVFRMTTWGESHGPAIGVVIDGCPAGLKIDADLIQSALERRRPGKTPWTSPRSEPDKMEILSGVFEGVSTGAPISMLIWNRDQKTTAYEDIKNVYRPGHANFSWLQKYGVFDWRGGGRASARETACRVMAGAVANIMLSDYGIEVVAYLKQVGSVIGEAELSDYASLKANIAASPIFCPDRSAEARMISQLEAEMEKGDSLGAVVEVVAFGVPAGIGEPTYRKVHSHLAQALMTIPAAKGFEVGEGFNAAELCGSSHNDGYTSADGSVKPSGNSAGGVLGGVSTGMPIVCRVAFKPPSSIRIPQETTTTDGTPTTMSLPPGSRHDPCIGIRAVPVVQAMTQLALADLVLMNRACKSQPSSLLAGC